MAEQDQPINPVSEKGGADIPMSSSKESGEQDDKYKSQPEGKVAFADFLVYICGGIAFTLRLMPLNSGYSFTLLNWI